MRQHSPRRFGWFNVGDVEDVGDNGAKSATAAAMRDFIMLIKQCTECTDCLLPKHGRTWLPAVANMIYNPVFNLCNLTLSHLIL